MARTTLYNLYMNKNKIYKEDNRSSNLSLKHVRLSIDFLPYCFAIDTDLSPSKASMKKYSLYDILFDEFLFGDLLNYLRGLPWQS
ncbi:hypothetical protein H8356DRAFT_1415914 [Neocallimastix lanati (nom. inval.)]|nr:hypothetical protein H8356DRAFT_1415914 [Neocallimastix sp. JGI-2020a]